MSSKLFIIFFFFIIISSSFTFAADTDDSKALQPETDTLKSLIVELNDSNFEKTISVSTTATATSPSKTTTTTKSSSSSWFILFYSSSCFGCHAILPSIEMFATNMRKSGEHDVNVAKVDCNPLQPEIYEASKQTCKRFHVQSFPTMIYIIKNAKTNFKPQIWNYFNYRGEKSHTADSILHFVRDPQNAVMDEVTKKIKNMEEKGEQVPQSLRDVMVTSYRPWDEDRIPNEIVSWADEFWHFVDEVNWDFTRRTKGKIHPAFFWAFVIFIGGSLIVVMIAAIFDLFPRRRRISEIRKQQQDDLKVKMKKEE